MTMLQRVVLILGVVFVLIGVAGLFVPGGMEMGVTAPGLLLGLFPVNLVHNLVHILLGVWALVAWRGFDSARSYALIVGGIYAALAVLGFISPTMFGLAPIDGNDIWLHVLLAVILLAVGITAKPAAATVAAP